MIRFEVIYFVKIEKFVFTPGLWGKNAAMLFLQFWFGFSCCLFSAHHPDRTFLHISFDWSDIMVGGACFMKNRGNLLFFHWQRDWAAKESFEEQLAEVVRAQHIVEGVLYKDVQISHLWTEEIIWAKGVYRRRAGATRLQSSGLMMRLGSIACFNTMWGHPTWYYHPRLYSWDDPLLIGCLDTRKLAQPW